jgi:hypothetical protein
MPATFRVVWDFPQPVLTAQNDTTVFFYFSMV